jgi:virulence factor Mce-like protein
MNRRPGDTGLATNPVLIGALTILVTVVAVFVTYNANSGLPFVPSYEVAVQLPDGNGLQNGRDVRIGGTRVGTVTGVSAVVRSGKTYAQALLKLEDRFGPIRSDSVVAVRPLSALGLKYLEIEPGKHGRTIPNQGTLPLRQAKPSIDLATTLGQFDAGTGQVGRGQKGGAQAELARRGTGLVGLGTALAGPVAALAGVAPASAELGTGLAGRGTDLNRVLEQSPELLARIRRVSLNLADPRTRLHRFLAGADAVTGELAAARPDLGGVLQAGQVTFAAVAGQRAALEDGISQLPSTELAGTRALAAARPLLSDATVFLRDARPGLRVLRPASRQLHLALRDGIPVLRDTPPLARRLQTALGSVDKLVRDPNTTVTLRKLRTTSLLAIPMLEYTAPAQIDCNYLALFARNSASVVSEGDRSGTWLRFQPIQATDEVTARADPAPELHVDTYPNTAAPGQNGECEAGKEPFLPGRHIGAAPGFQGRTTESTSPSSVIPPEPLK